MVATANTAEQFTVRHLVDYRGGSLALSLFAGTVVSAPALAAVYHGRPVDDLTWSVVQNVLRERLTY